ncbi:uncharacterized protein LOC117642325 [Thrips palmi]|uniref:Uncharacterized protein LOC117642325 n=1 Tax=Thrips palmi TaxID=161013 RepID=A0A6P8YI48_THRPL|nr:uncharacterized protein LOC117642325 [Thrips palmi]
MEPTLDTEREETLPPTDSDTEANPLLGTTGAVEDFTTNTRDIPAAPEDPHQATPVEQDTLESDTDSGFDGGDTVVFRLEVNPIYRHPPAGLISDLDTNPVYEYDEPPVFDRETEDLISEFAQATRPLDHITQTNGLYDPFAVQHNILPFITPLYPKYSTLESRMNTFDSWPKDAHVSSKALAEDGFYYLGHSDIAMCFHCGMSLCHWAKDDVPPFEHATFSPYCGFLLRNHGRKFVDQVQNVLHSVKDVPEHFSHIIKKHLPEEVVSQHTQQDFATNSLNNSFRYSCGSSVYTVIYIVSLCYCSDELPEELLPEDDSMFNDLSARADISSDALVEDDSFNEFADDAQGPTSTPSSRARARLPGNAGSPRRSARLASPGRSPTAESTTNSPRRSARLASPSGSPNAGPSSPRRSARLASPRGSPKAGPSTQSQKNSARPSTSSSLPAPPLPQRTSQQTKGKGKKAQPKPSRMKCPKCPPTLSNKKTLDAHLRGHLMSGVTSRAPSLEELTQEMLPLMKAALQDMLTEPIIGDLSQLVHDYCLGLNESLDDPTLDNDLLSHLSLCFSEVLSGRKALFPSAIRTSMYVGTNNLLCSPEFRKTMKDFFQLLKECDGNVLNVFLGDFMCSLSRKVIVMCMKKMRGGLNSDAVPLYTKRSGDDFESVEFRQEVYHISGSIVNGFLWKGVQYTEDSKTWVKYCAVLRDNLLFKSGSEAAKRCSDEVRHFSESKDRGGYKHVNDDTFQFFLSVFILLHSSESEYGSLPPNVIDNSILVSEVILCLWDELVGNDLTQDESLDLLIQICQSCVKVTVKGIIKRRINQHLKKAQNSVPLRALMAPKTAGKQASGRETLSWAE